MHPPPSAPTRSRDERRDTATEREAGAAHTLAAGPVFVRASPPVRALHDHDGMEGLSGYLSRRDGGARHWPCACSKRRGDCRRSAWYQAMLTTSPPQNVSIANPLSRYAAFCARSAHGARGDASAASAARRAAAGCGRGEATFVSERLQLDAIGFPFARVSLALRAATDTQPTLRQTRAGESSWRRVGRAPRGSPWPCHPLSRSA